MKKSIDLLFTQEDEYSFSREIRAIFPYVAFIDDMYWPTKTPPSRASITDCKSKIVLIWDRKTFPELPSLARNDGTFHGPQSGMVIQLERSVMRENELLSGSLAAGFDANNFAMKHFAEGVWKILKKLTPKKVVQVNPSTLEELFRRTDMRLGNDAFGWCHEEKGRFLRYNNSPFIYMRPAE